MRDFQVFQFRRVGIVFTVVALTLFGTNDFSLETVAILFQAKRPFTLASLVFSPVLGWLCTKRERVLFQFGEYRDASCLFIGNVVCTLDTITYSLFAMYSKGKAFTVHL